MSWWVGFKNLKKIVGLDSRHVIGYINEYLIDGKRQCEF